MALLQLNILQTVVFSDHKVSLDWRKPASVNNTRAVCKELTGVAISHQLPAIGKALLKLKC